MEYLVKDARVSDGVILWSGDQAAVEQGASYSS